MGIVLANWGEVEFGEGKTYKSFSCTQWTGMYTLEDTMQDLIHFGHPLRRRRTPGQKDDPFHPLLGHDVDNPLGELLPATFGMTGGLVCTHGQACVQHQHAAVRPGREQASPVRRWFEARVVLLQRDINVLQRRGRLTRGPHGEAEPMRLADVVVWVLAENYDLDILKRCVLGPAGGEPVPLSVDSLTPAIGNHGIHPHQC